MKTMKYLAVLLTCGVMGIQNICAQLAGSNLFTHETVNTSDYKKNNLGVELGVGSRNNVSGTELDLGLGYMYRVSPYWGIDAIGIKAMAITGSSNVLIQCMVGLRAFTPEFSKASLYVNYRCGYGGFVEGLDTGGFCFESGCGISFSSKYYIGYAFDGNNKGGSPLICNNSVRFGIYF